MTDAKPHQLTLYFSMPSIGTYSVPIHTYGDFMKALRSIADEIRKDIMNDKKEENYPFSLFRNAQVSTVSNWGGYYPEGYYVMPFFNSDGQLCLTLAEDNLNRFYTLAHIIFSEMPSSYITKTRHLSRDSLKDIIRYHRNYSDAPMSLVRFNKTIVHNGVLLDDVVSYCNTLGPHRGT